MHYAVKLTAAGVVLLAGISVALLFRHKPELADCQGDAPGDHLVLRRHIEPPKAKPAAELIQSGYNSTPVPVASQRPNRVTFLMPMDRGQAPPTLAKDFPAFDLVARADPSRKATTTGSGTSGQTLPTTHYVVDGDSLESLAIEYLGSEDRAGEILAANREQLPNPSILPIGLLLHIPPRTPPTACEGNLMPKRPLLPVSEPEKKR